jgi:hypothetical protein
MRPGRFGGTDRGDPHMAEDTSIFIGASRKPDDSYQRAEELL